MGAVSKLKRSAVVFLVAFCAVGALAHAAVENYIPADAVVILKIEDPLAQWDKFVESPLFGKLEDPSFIPDVANGIAMGRTNVQQFEAQTGIGLRQVASNLLGREVAIFGLPGDMGGALVEGRDAESLQKAVDQFLDIQRDSGDLTAESTSTYKGVTIHSGMQKGGEGYHAIAGNVLVVSDKAAAVQKVIDVVQGAPALAGSPKYRDAMRMAGQDAPVRGYVDGAVLGAFVEQMQAAPRGTKPLGEAMRRRLVEVIPLINYLVLSVSEDAGLEAHVTVAYRDGRLPELLRNVLPEPGSRLDVLRLAPPSAVLAGARALDFEEFWNSLVEGVAAQDPAAAGKMQQRLDVVAGMITGIYSRDQLFDEIGTQMGLFVLPGSGPNALPAGVLAFELRQTAHIPAALRMMVGMGVMAAGKEQSQDISVKQSRYKDVQLTTVHGSKGPLAVLSPTFGVVDGYLVAATSLEAVQKVVDAARTNPAPRVGQPGTPMSLMTISVPQLRALLEQHREFLVKQTAAKPGKDLQQARREIEALDKLLTLFQSVGITNTFRPGRTDHYLTIELAGDWP